MNTRWKPSSGERYWTVSIEPAEGYVCPARWYDESFDNNVYAFGNCFETREQAEVALEKIKAVLMEGHDEDSDRP